VKVALSKRAARAAERISARWHAHADYPNVFAYELLQAVEVLETTQNPGSLFPMRKRPALKRLLLRKSQCHLYVEVDEANEMIRILHIRDGRRQRPPRL